MRECFYVQFKLKICTIEFCDYIIKINADENKNLADHFTGKGFPLLIAYKNKEIVWEKIGLLEQDALAKDIDELLTL